MLLPVGFEDNKYILANTLYEPIALKSVSQETLEAVQASLTDTLEVDAFNRALRVLQDKIEQQPKVDRQVIRVYGNFLTGTHTINKLRFELSDGTQKVATKKDCNTYQGIPEEILRIGKEYTKLLIYNFGGAMDYAGYYIESIRMSRTGAHQVNRDVEPMPDVRYPSYRQWVEKAGNTLNKRKEEMTDICIIDEKTHCPMLFSIDNRYRNYYLVVIMPDTTKEFPDGKCFIQGINTVGNISNSSVARGNILTIEEMTTYLNYALYPPISEEKAKAVYWEIRKVGKEDTLSTVYQVSELWLKKYNAKEIKWPNSTYSIAGTYNLGESLASISNTVTLFGSDMDYNQYTVDSDGTYHGLVNNKFTASDDSSTIVDLRDVKELGYQSIHIDPMLIHLVGNNLKKAQKGAFELDKRFLAKEVGCKYNFMILPMSFSVLDSIVRQSNLRKSLQIIIPVRIWLQQKKNFLALCNYLCKIRMYKDIGRIEFKFDMDFEKIESDGNREIAYNNKKYTSLVYSTSEDGIPVRLVYDEYDTNDKLSRLVRNTIVYHFLQYLGIGLLDGTRHKIVASKADLLGRYRYQRQRLGTKISGPRSLTFVDTDCMAVVNFKTPLPLTEVANKYAELYIQLLLVEQFNPKNIESSTLHFLIVELCDTMKQYCSKNLDLFKVPYRKGQFSYYIIETLKEKADTKEFYWQENNTEVYTRYQEILTFMKDNGGYID